MKSKDWLMVFGYFLEISLFVIAGALGVFSRFLFYFFFIIAVLVSFWVGGLIKKIAIEKYQEEQIYIKKSIKRTLRDVRG